MHAGRFISARLKFLWRSLKSKRDRIHSELRALMHKAEYTIWLRHMEATDPMRVAHYFKTVKNLVAVPLQHPVDDVEYYSPCLTSIVMKEHHARQATWGKLHRRFEDHWEKTMVCKIIREQSDLQIFAANVHGNPQVHLHIVLRIFPRQPDSGLVTLFHGGPRPCHWSSPHAARTRI